MEPAAMNRSYLSIDCPECDEPVLDGPVGTTLMHDGLPVVPSTMFEQETFQCENEECGHRSGIGELDREEV